MVNSIGRLESIVIQENVEKSQRSRARHDLTFTGFHCPLTVFLAFEKGRKVDDDILESIIILCVCRTVGLPLGGDSNFAAETQSRYVRFLVIQNL